MQNPIKKQTIQIRRKNIFISIIFAITILSFSTLTKIPSALGESGGIDWKSYDKGISMAKEKNKKIFLYFHADWCGYCRQMDMSTFKEKQLIDYMNENFVAIKINSDHEKKTADSYGVRGLPTSWFLKADSEKLSSMPGYVDAKRLLKILKYVHTESYEKMSYADFENTL